MLIEQLSCNECLTLKKETNHWWALQVQVVRGQNSIVLAALSDVPEDELRDWNHYDGRNCVLQALSRYLETGSLEKVSQEVPPHS